MFLTGHVTYVFCSNISADVRDYTHAVKVKYGHVCREKQSLVSI